MAIEGGIFKSFFATTIMTNNRKAIVEAPFYGPLKMCARKHFKATNLLHLGA